MEQKKPSTAPQLMAGIESENLSERLVAVGHNIWQIEAQARTLVLAQNEVAKSLPQGLTDECTKNLAAVHGVAQNLCGWLDEICREVFKRAEEVRLHAAMNKAGDVEVKAIH